MIVNLENVSVHVQYIHVYMYESPVYDLCLTETLFFTERSLNHQNPGATIPLEQMIPNVSVMAENIIQ